MHIIFQGFIMSLFFLLCSCASFDGPLTNVNPNAHPPEVNTGPEMILLDKAFTLSAVMGHDGLAHVFTEVLEGQKHFIIGPNGLAGSDVIKKKDMAWPFDLTVDAEGQLHAQSREKHFMLEHGLWQEIPWQPCSPFIRGDRELTVCVKTVSGKETGSEKQWEGFFFIAGGGGGACCVGLPWLVHQDKLVLTKRTGSQWFIHAAFDPRVKFNVKNYKAVLDKKRTLHVAYYGGRTIIHNTLDSDMFIGRLIYAKVELPGENSYQDHSSKKDLSDNAPEAIDAIQGRMVQGGSGANFDIAADSETGNVLIVFQSGLSLNSSSVRNGLPETPVEIIPYTGKFLLAAAGRDRYHMLVTAKEKIYYLEYDERGWSAPIEIGERHPQRTVILIADSSGQALVAWIKEDGKLVARWISVRNKIMGS